MTPLHMITERISFFRSRSVELNEASRRQPSSSERETLERLAFEYAELAHRMEVKIAARLAAAQDARSAADGKHPGVARAISRWENEGGAADAGRSRTKSHRDPLKSRMWPRSLR